MSTVDFEKGCDQGATDELEDFEEWAIRGNDKTGTWGRLCFDTELVTTDRKGQAYWILGLKALSNFNYDYCQFGFKKLVEHNPNFIMGYWGQAMCEAHLLWDIGDPGPKMSPFLETGRKISKEAKVQSNGNEERLYKATQALSSKKKEGDQKDRYENFAKFCQSWYEKYPSNGITGAYAVLSKLALAGLTCTDFTHCDVADEARQLAEDLFKHETLSEIYKHNGAFVHYALHAFDYPDASIYSKGLLFAETYPNIVTGAVHSLHMPSHIDMRAGKWQQAASGNHLSVVAGESYQFHKVLVHNKGTLGSLDRKGPVVPSGYPFSWDAGNLYHSLEFEQYAVLQGCNYQRAASQLKHMRVAAFQALTAAGSDSQPPGEEGATHLGDAWLASTTYHGWLYRMEARLTGEAMFQGLLGDMGPIQEQLPGGTTLPLPLDWAGKTEYAHNLYAPQSEAGLWNAISLASLLGNSGRVDTLLSNGALWQFELDAWPPPPIIDSKKELPSEADGGPKFPRGVCGPSTSDEEADVSGVKCVVAMAQQRIRQVHAFYTKVQQTQYEASLTAALWHEVASAAHLDEGSIKDAVESGRKAADLEWSAADQISPSSTSVFFISGTAFYGALALRLAGHGHAAAPLKRQLLNDAKTAFERCLDAKGRPMLSVCLLGQARVLQQLGDTGAAKKAAYGHLLHIYRHGSPEGAAAQVHCAAAYKEAEAVAGQRGSGSGWFIVVLLILALAAFAVGIYLRCRSANTGQAGQAAEPPRDEEGLEDDESVYGGEVEMMDMKTSSDAAWGGSAGGLQQPETAEADRSG